MKPRYLFRIFSGILLIHFAIVIAFLFSDIHNIHRVNKYTSYYVQPFFSQHWSMFSNPGSSDIYVLFKFKNGTDSTKWLDVTTPMMKRGLLLVSIDQRISKYLDGSIISVLKAYNVARKRHKDLKPSGRGLRLAINDVQLSNGYLNLMEYSRFVYKKVGFDKTRMEQTVVSIKITIAKYPSFEERSNLSFKKQYYDLVFPFTKI